MKFLLNIQQSWPEEAKKAGGFKHEQAVTSKKHFVINDIDQTITESVFQSPVLDCIPSNSFLKITQQDNTDAYFIEVVKQKFQYQHFSIEKRDVSKAKVHMFLHDDNLHVTTSVIEAPILDNIEKYSLLRVTQID